MRIGENQPLPYNAEVEQAVLGIMFVDPRKVDDGLETLEESDFFIPAHQRIFQAISEVSATGKVPTPVTLKNHFDWDKDLEHLGGGVYMAELAGSVISAVNFDAYCKTLKDLRMRRNLIESAQQVIEKARHCEYDVSAQDILDGAESDLFRMAEDGHGDDGPCALSGVLNATYDYIQNIQHGRESGVPSGILSLDEKTNGFWPGELIIVAGRPSMGKTAFALTAAHNAAQQRKNVLFFSLEMSKEQLAQRLFSRHTNIATGFQNRKGAFEARHFQAIANAAGEMSGLTLAVDDRSGLSVHQIRARARRYKRRHGLDLVIIDQLGLISMLNNFSSKVDQIGEVTRALKVMARDLNVPVVLLHQLNRSVETREDKRPMLADLRDSGNIEQDADVVIFLYREEYYLEKSPPRQKSNESNIAFGERNERYRIQIEQVRGKASIIVAKLRQGNCGEAQAIFNGQRQIFADPGELEERASW